MLAKLSSTVVVWMTADRVVVDYLRLVTHNSHMPDEHQQEEMEIQFVNLLPAEWNAQQAGHSFWITCFRILMVDDAPPVPPTVTVLTESVLVAMHGSMGYIKPRVEIEASPGNEPTRLNVTDAELKNLPMAPYLFIVLPYDKPGLPGDEPSTINRVDELVALASIELGRNAVGQRLFDNIVDFAGNQVTGASPAISTPDWHGIPLLTNAATNRLKAIEISMSTASVELKNRITLGLRWYAHSFEDQHVDGFLAAWFAIETVGMPDTTNIAPLVQMFADAYNLTIQQVRDEFQLGRLQSVRSDIVHNGVQPVINSLLISYMQAVFVDVVRSGLGLPCEGRARIALADPRAPIADWFAGYPS